MTEREELLTAKLLTANSTIADYTEREIGALDMIRLLEDQLQDMGRAESHPRWTNTGEIALVGDLGLLGDPDLENRLECRIVGFNGLTGQVMVQPVDAIWSADHEHLPYGQLAELQRRSPIPPNR